MPKTESRLAELFAVTAGVITARFLWNRYSKTKREKELQEVADEARARRDAKVHKVLQDSVETKTKLPDGTPYQQLSATDVTRLVGSGELDPVELVRFLSKRCARYGRETGVNAITEEFYEEALISAQKCGQTGNGVLRGVPLSVKDCLGQRGALCTIGMACRASEDQRFDEDSVVVQCIQDAGGFVLVRGNVPQSMMVPETENHIFGRTVNPWDSTRTPGGSSGGDAALVAMECVPLAVGTDVGGSIRIPAANCGIVGFKPTPHRISHKNCPAPRLSNRNGMDLIIPSAIGPIARTVDDCALFMEAVWTNDHFCSDSSVPPMVFGKDVYQSKKKLKLGYFRSDGWFQPCKAVARGLNETICKLRAAGHELEEFELPASGWQTYPLYCAIVTSDGNMREQCEGLEGEKLLDMYNIFKLATHIPNFVRDILAPILDERRASLLRQTRSGGISSYELLQCCGELIELRKKWDDAFRDSGVDAIIHPALPLPAVHCGATADLLSMVSYTMLANLLLWPSGTCPVSTVRKDEQHYSIEDLPSNQRDVFAKSAEKCMQGSAGLPVSVAVLTPQFRDEMCLRVMKEVEHVVKFEHKPKNYLNA